MASDEMAMAAHARMRDEEDRADRLVELADLMLGCLDAIYTGAAAGKVPDLAGLRKSIFFYEQSLKSLRDNGTEDTDGDR